MDKVLQFLHELSENNNREWFDDNRKRYHENRDKIIFLTNRMENKIVEGESFIEHTVQTFRELCKVNRFLYEALEK
ncbi:MAG: DUF2461 domain-containing protein [Draconibacterium sp.]|nr:DUF2461 domain-containing protein [Draconibacterium sp.]